MFPASYPCIIPILSDGLGRMSSLDAILPIQLCFPSCIPSILFNTAYQRSLSSAFTSSSTLLIISPMSLSTSQISASGILLVSISQMAPTVGPPLPCTALTSTNVCSAIEPTFKTPVPSALISIPLLKLFPPDLGPHRVTIIIGSSAR